MNDTVSERQELSQKLGQRIRLLRKQRGLSLEALALKCDMNAAFLGHIERGLRCPTVYTLERVSSGLGVNLVELLVDDISASEHTAAIQHFSNVIAPMTKEQVETLLQILDSAASLAHTSDK